MPQWIGGLRVAVVTALWACVAPAGAQTGPGSAAQPAVQLLLIGEQHDASDHQRIQADTVRTLAAQGALSALALEMADAGHDTRGLPADATESAVRERLHWNDAGWPWAAYGPVVMAAVRASVPVVGANLPRSRSRETMADASLDGTLDTAALDAQRAAVRDGHCGLLPESQIAPMTRIQIARDRQMAQTLVSLASRVPLASRQAAAAEVTAASAAYPRTVVLVAGGGHVLRDRGVPRHLPPAQSVRVLWLQAGDGTPPATLTAADELRRTPALPPRDYCAELREQFRSRGKP